ncbi:MAG: extracellular solute-binding protein [Oscillospiraceae bacterium]|nr:extracellular solute-binding protein [Oscillospiraceae bacterium]
MKKWILLLCLAAFLLSLLTGCAGAKPAAPAESTAPEEVWSARFQTLRFPEGAEPRFWAITDGSLYAASYEKLADGEIPEGKTLDYEGQYDVMGWRLYRVAEDGDAVPLDYAAAPAPADTEGRRGYTASSDVAGLLAGPDGSLLVVESTEQRWYTGEEKDPGRDPDYWEHTAYERRFFTCRLDADGRGLRREPLELDGAEPYLFDCAADAQGRLFLPAEGQLCVFAADGTAPTRIQIGDGWIYGLARLRDGRMAALLWQNGMRLCAVDAEKGELCELLALDAYPDKLYEGGGAYDLYRVEGTRLLGLRIEDGSEETVLDFLDCDLSPQELQLLAPAGDGSLQGVYRTDGEAPRRVTLQKQPYDKTAERTELTLGTIGTQGVSDAVLRFNRAQDKVRIRVRDYSDYVRGDDYEAGLTKLVTEILAGDMPDLLALESLPYAQLAAKGLLEDLYPWLDADGELSREDFFDNVLRSMEVGGRLYEAAPGFSIITMMGPSELVGDTPGWTYDEFDAALAAMPEGSTPLGPGVDRDMILTVCTYLNLDRFLDWSSGTCRFEDPAFLRMLAFCAQFPDPAVSAPDEDSSDMSRIAEGRQLLVFTSLSNMNDAVYNDQLFPGGSTYIGLPTDEGVGNILYPASGCAMSAKCADKAAAWSFLRGFFTEEHQKRYSDCGLGMPLNRGAFRAALDEAMEIEYEKDAAGHYLLDANGERIPTTKGGMSVSTDGEARMDFELWAMTPEQAEKLLGVVEGATRAVDMNATIAGIVCEEAAAFFAGQKSAEEVARLIQSKVNLYVSEQR